MYKKISPLVSIVIPCYNSERYIGKLLDSILEQKYDRIEVIAVNDGSKDTTAEILRKYQRRFKGSYSLKVIYKDNNGMDSAAGAIDVGIKHFTGDYLSWIDADDFLATPDSVRIRVAFLEDHKDVDIVFGKTDFVDGDYKTIDTVAQARNNLFMAVLLEEGYIWQPVSLLLRASSFLAVNPNRSIYVGSASGQNIQMLLPVYYKGKAGYIDETTAAVLVHEDSHSRKQRNPEELTRYIEGVKATYINTLKRIDMPELERETYLAIIDNKYEGQPSYLCQQNCENIVIEKDELTNSFLIDMQNFRDNFVHDIKNANQTQLDAKLVFSSHSMEKSLSNDNFEIGHGFSVAKVLIELLEIYNRKQYSTNDLAYVNTTSVLKTFYEKHKGSKYQNEIEEIFGEFLNEIKSCKSQIGGADVLSSDSKRDNSSKNFADLAKGRFAVRDYADKPVSEELIKEVIMISQKTPSVCNRQPTRVYYLTDKKLITKILKIQDGIAFYDVPPVLFVITATDNAYVGLIERNQGYIDGGLFTMSLLYALEHKGLAACPLHAMFDTNTRDVIRSMLNIPKSEKLIVFISAGHFRLENKICKSFRYPPEYVSKKITKLARPVQKSINLVHSVDSKDTEIIRLDSEVARLNVELQSHLGLKRSARLLAGNVKRKLHIRTRFRQMTEKIHARTADGTIVTLTGYFNYGNIMQRYALQSFLKNNGYNFIISLNNTGPTDPSIIHYTKLFCERRLREMAIDIQNPRDIFKNYIVGSDQVWRNWGTEPIEYYFLNFVKNPNARKIAYAASFGVDNLNGAGISQELSKKLQILAKDFTAISVREKAGAKILKKEWQISDVANVLDPTMLLTKQDYSRIIDNPVTKLEKVNELFVYVLDDDEEIRQLIYRVSKKEKYKVSENSIGNDKPLKPVEQWLKGFRDAKFVITDSFHGMVFSIINNTDFMVIANEERGLARFTSILELLGLEDRLAKKEDIAKISDLSDLKDICWKDVNTKLNRLREQSGGWLISRLNIKE